MKKILTIAAILLLSGCIFDDAEKYPHGKGYRIEAGGYAVAPHGYVDMIKRKHVKTTEERWNDVNAVFRYMKRNFIPVKDSIKFGKKEHWRVMPMWDMEGDCEDFALTARSLLYHHGWTGDDMMLVYCKANVSYHVVFVVLIDGEQFVMDNLERSVVPVDRHECEYLKVIVKGIWYNVE